jgi:hypothetical protein
MRLLLAAVILMFGATSHVSAGDERPRIPIEIAICDGFGVSPGHIVRATRTAAGILREAGLAANWVPCTRDLRSTPGRRRSPLMVRFVPGPPTDFTANYALGYSVVDTAVGTGKLATVFPDRVRRLTARLPLDTGVLLGRVVAHELGHLLLGSMAHSGSGLMRASWPLLRLRANDHRDWLFSAADADRLRRSIAVDVESAGTAPAAAAHEE